METIVFEKHFLVPLLSFLDKKIIISTLFSTCNDDRGDSGKNSLPRDIAKLKFSQLKLQI